MFANVTEPGVVGPMAAALAIGLGSLGPGIGIGLAVKAAMEAIDAVESV